MGINTYTKCLQLSIINSKSHLHWCWWRAPWVLSWWTLPGPARHPSASCLALDGLLPRHGGWCRLGLGILNHKANSCFTWPLNSQGGQWAPLPRKLQGFAMLWLRTFHDVILTAFYWSKDLTEARLNPQAWTNGLYLLTKVVTKSFTREHATRMGRSVAFFSPQYTTYAWQSYSIVSIKNCTIVSMT